MHLPEQSLQLPQDVDGFLIRNILNFDTGENNAPKGQRYLQKNLSIKSEPIIITSISAPPMERRYSAEGKPLKVAYIPKIVHGLHKVVPVAENVHIPTTINSKTAYLRSLSILSAFWDTLIFFGICLPPNHKRSCIAPNEHINPQKNLPQMKVMIKTADTRTICQDCSEILKVPCIIEVYIAPKDENMLIKSPGMMIKEII